MDPKQLDELKLTGALPSPSGVGMLILQLTQGDDYAMGEITRVIRSDPALTGRILRLANSSVHAGFEPVRTVNDAAMRLGVCTVRNLALGFTLVSGYRSGTCAGFDYEGYWSHSLASAVAAQALATELRTMTPADAFTCGLLHGIGRLALASIHPEKYSLVLARARAEGYSDVAELEREALDLDHRELAGAMLRDWNLPESFARAVERFERAEPDGTPDELAGSMAALLRAAVRVGRACLARTGAGGISWEEGWPDLEDLRQELGLSLERFAILCDDAAREWQEWGAIMQIRTNESPHLLEVARRTAQTPRLPARQDKAAPAERKGLRVLAVDDDPISLRLLEHHLVRDGHTVERAVDGRQALAMALESNPQMVLTDWMMPELDGLELCKALRRTTEGRGTYILLLTGREDEDRVVEAFHAGADEYVVKPFNPKILLARVRAGQRMIELREQVERDRRDRAKQVSEMAVLNRRLQAAALTDVLTELPNRRYAMRRLDQEVAACRRSGNPVSLIMIDIDEFKSVNDRFGHDVGDLVLRETAAVLQRNTRKGDMVCRLGGEEFLVICTNCDLECGARTAERIRAAVEAHEIGGGFPGHVTISLGVATLENEHTSVDALLKIADRRAYIAKTLGRNRVCASDGEERRVESA